VAHDDRRLHRDPDLVDGLLIGAVLPCAARRRRE